MRWDKKNKELIKQVIDRYYWMLKKKSRYENFFGNYDDCLFCNEYMAGCYCYKLCPNSIINKMLNIHRKIYGFYCFANVVHIGIFNKGSHGGRTNSNIKKRIQFWEDALALTKKEFVRKYKKC